MQPASHDAWYDQFGTDTPHQDTRHIAEALMQQTFGRALRVLRTRMRLSQDALGAIIGYRPETLARIEAGQRAPSLWKALTIATFFGTSVEVMCGFPTPPASPAAADENEDEDDDER